MHFVCILPYLYLKYSKSEHLVEMLHEHKWKKGMVVNIQMCSFPDPLKGTVVITEKNI